MGAAAVAVAVPGAAVPLSAALAAAGVDGLTLIMPTTVLMSCPSAAGTDMPPTGATTLVGVPASQV